MKTIYLRVDGIICYACVEILEHAVREVAGVIDAGVNFVGETMWITMADDSAQSDVMEAIRKRGYQAIEISQEQVMRNESGNLDKLRKTILICFVLSVPLVSNPWFCIPASIQLVLATIVQVLGGNWFYHDAVRAVSNRSANMSVLVSIGTLFSYGYSSFVVLFGQQYGLHDVYFEASGMVLVLVMLGKYLEGGARRQANTSLQELYASLPSTAYVLRDGQCFELNVEQVSIGDMIMIRPGEIIPMDAVVIIGKSHVDQFVLTGESIPVEKGPGDELLGGTINYHGQLTAKVTVAYKDNVAQSMLQALITTMRGRRPEIQRLADKISGIFIPSVMILSLITLFLWQGFVEPGNFARALQQAVSVLVIACPCAMGIATSMAVTIAVGAMAQSGIFVKEPAALETLEKLQVVAFDKTGTLTSAKLQVCQQLMFNVHSTDMWTKVVSLQMASRHPIAAAVRALAGAENIQASTVYDYKELPEGIVSGIVDGSHVYAGRPEHIMKYCTRTEKKLVDDCIKACELWRDKGMIASAVCIDSYLAGAFACCDRIRAGSHDTVRTLQKLGINVVILTGDNKAPTADVAAKCGISNYQVDLLPMQKSEAIRDMSAHHVTAMVGDGLNDALCIADATLGIVIGDASAVTAKHADIVITQNKITHLLKAIYIGTMTMRNVRRGLFWALFYNCIGIGLAMGGVLTPVYAGAAMSLSSLFVVLNAHSLSGQLEQISFSKVEQLRNTKPT